MAKAAKRRDQKSEALAQDGVLNRHPDAIRDVLFSGNPFFDPKDLVQVRYEMVRRHQVDGAAISKVAAAFGVSRPTFYKAQDALETAGLAGSATEPAGPQRWPQDLCRGDCLRRRTQGRDPRADDATMSRRDRAALRRQGAPAEPRTRAGAQKKTKQSALIVAAADAVGAYEKLRAAVLNAEPSSCSGLGIIRHRGLAAWIRECGSEPQVEAVRTNYHAAPTTTRDLPPAASDLTRLLAGIIVALATEPTHAHG